MTTETSGPAPSAPRVIREPQMWVQWAALMGVPLEYLAFLTASPILRTLGRGHHHPVLVMPGFMGDDMSTAPLRSLIGSWGHRAYGWGGGPNPGPTAEVLASLDTRLENVFAEAGEKVSLVGWSAGGRYARYLARRHPDMVRQVITLACPLQLRITHDRTSISFVTDRVKHTFAPGFGDDPDYAQGPLPVPATSIYSRTDGVVRWYACLDVMDDAHENVEVYASHVGVGVNPSVLYVVADRLAQADGDWRPFSAPPWLRPVYPRAASWRLHDPQARDAEELVDASAPVGLGVAAITAEDPIERLRADAALLRAQSS